MKPAGDAVLNRRRGFVRRDVERDVEEAREAHWAALLALAAAQRVPQEAHEGVLVSVLGARGR
eukprot:2620871-Prorocentrum_lima.AAC.1